MNVARLAVAPQVPPDAVDVLTPTFWTALLMLGALTLAGLLIVRIGKWMKKPDTDLAAADELTRFRQLYERGELGRDEYEKIKAKLVPRMRKELDLPAKPKEAPPPESAGP